MKIYKTSQFKDEKADQGYFENWVSQLELLHPILNPALMRASMLGGPAMWLLLQEKQM